MAGRAKVGSSIGQVKHRARASQVFRFAGRLTAAAVALLVLTLVAAQFARVLGDNIAAARQLSAVRTDIAMLQKRRALQIREIHRLQNPAGAIPEIHDRLRLVRRNEAIVFVRPAPSTAP